MTRYYGLGLPLSRSRWVSPIFFVTTFGDGGRQPGLFFAVHSIATDSKGNVYTTETYNGRRLQKFDYQGLKPVTGANSGAPWPADEL